MIKAVQYFVGYLDLLRQNNESKKMQMQILVINSEIKNSSPGTDACVINYARNLLQVTYTDL